MCNGYQNISINVIYHVHSNYICINLATVESLNKFYFVSSPISDQSYEENPLLHTMVDMEIRLGFDPSTFCMGGRMLMQLLRFDSLLVEIMI